MKILLLGPEGKFIRNFMKVVEDSREYDFKFEILYIRNPLKIFTKKIKYDLSLRLWVAHIFNFQT